MDERLIPVIVAVISACGGISGAVITAIGKKEENRLTMFFGVVCIGAVIAGAIIVWILLQTPSVPSARIARPGYSDGPVPLQTSVVVKYNHIPPGRYLWVVVRVPKVQPDWVVFPQLLSGMPTPVEGAGTFETTIQLGDIQKDIGDPFNVVLLLLDEEANRSFVEYSKNCIKLGACGGIQLPDTGAQVLDFNTVIRK